jgi:4-amino-4-deoxy-L-arabinose transferase-like glycosyltransferase
LRALDDAEPHPRRWAAVFWAAMAVGVLLKGLIGVLFPAAVTFCYLLFSRQLRMTAIARLRPVSGMAIFLAIALPWHVLATLRNPPYFDFSLHSGPGHYRGFFWFYFMNEQVLRFLNLRYPRDYNTVPRPYFWLFHLLWFFPWSMYFGGLARLGYKPADRAGRTRFLALCWIGFVMLFFTFSTTQEYYSMPIYPALALLAGCLMTGESRWLRIGTRVAGAVAGVAAVAIGTILYLVRHVPAPGDISTALTQNPDLYTLSLGHMLDLTLPSFAYLRLPLALAGVACLTGALGVFLKGRRRQYLALAAMMVIFFQAARLALVAFDPYMSSRPLAEALKRAPRGKLIAGDQYYTFSSVFFYTDYSALLLNGRVNNLEYGSNAPGAPQVFIGDEDLRALWPQPDLWYLIIEDRRLPEIEKLAGRENLHMVATAGGKSLYSNHEIAVLARTAGGHATLN